MTGLCGGLFCVVSLCFVFQRSLVRLGMALMLNRTECNQHLLLYPDLPSELCQIIVASSSVWPDHSCEPAPPPIATKPPGPLPTHTNLPAWASHLRNRESPPAPPWQPPAWARAYHLYLAVIPLWSVNSPSKYTPCSASTLDQPVPLQPLQVVSWLIWLENTTLMLLNKFIFQLWPFLWSFC